MPEEKLKPCICGGEPELKELYGRFYWYACKSCGSFSALMNTKEDALAAWNDLSTFYEKLNAAHTAEDGEESKPPLGVIPYWVELKNRIKELAQAISRQANYVPTPDQRKKSNGLMRGWAQEIQKLLDVIDFLDETRE